MENQLIDLFARKSSEELLRIVTTERHTYQSAAIQAAADILKARGVNYAITPEVVVEQKIHDKISRPVGPFIVGALMAVLGFVELPITMDYEAAWTVTITLNILMRIIVVGWSYSLAGQFNLNKKLWIILGLLFGGWSLIAMGLVIWTVTAESTDGNNGEQPVPQSEEIPGNCPACSFKLEGSVKSCPDCGLTLTES